MRTKGEAEQAIISLKFPLCYIYRPGLLDRGDSKRMIEKLGLFFLPSTYAPCPLPPVRISSQTVRATAFRPVAAVARVMASRDCFDKKRLLRQNGDWPEPAQEEEKADVERQFAPFIAVFEKGDIDGASAGD